MRFFTLSLLLTLAACQSSTPKADTSAPATAAKPLPRVVTLVNTGSTAYYVYLPTGYTVAKKYPLLLFFDAHARGRLPLNLYDTLADKNGWIIACSAQAKNQLQPAEYQRIYHQTLTHLLANQSIDTSMLMLGGFSGGARVAYQLAVDDSRIKAVLLNSAGFDVTTPLREGLTIVGLAGIEDFNLSEMFSSFRELFRQNNSAAALYLEFEGKHEWAPETRMDLAFDFLKRASQADSRSEVTQEARNEFKRVMQRLTRVLALEEQQRSDYSAHFAERPLRYYQAETAKLNQTNASFSGNGGIEIAYSSRRLQQYLSMLAYSYSHQALGQGSLELAQKFTDVYQAVDSTNAEWAYLKAVIAARQNNADEAATMLQKAASLGFDNKNQRAQTQPEFSPLLSNAKLAQAIAALQAKEE